MHKKLLIMTLLNISILWAPKILWGDLSKNNSQDNSLSELKVVSLVGEVFFNGEAIKPGVSLKKSGLLVTKEKSRLKIMDSKQGHTYILSNNTRLRMDKSNLSSYYGQRQNAFTLLEGALRVLLKGKEDFFLKLRTHRFQATMDKGEGVFFSTPLFKESEAIALSGAMVIQIFGKEKQKSIDLRAGNWLGVGHRFESEAHANIKKLHKELKDHYRKLDI
jgi:hypothetical protein